MMRRTHPKKLAGLLLLPLIVVLAGGCSGIRVQSDYDPSIDFRDVEDYAWLSPDQDDGAGIPAMNDLLTQRIRRNVNNALQARGLRLTAPAEADVLIVARVVVEERVDVDTVHYGSMYGRWGSVYPGYARTYVHEYEVGTLVIDFVLPEERRLIWRGIGRTRLQDQPTPQEREAHIRAVVEAILDRYPPGGGKGK